MQVISEIYIPLATRKQLLKDSHLRPDIIRSVSLGPSLGRIKLQRYDSNYYSVNSPIHLFCSKCNKLIKEKLIYVDFDDREMILYCNALSFKCINCSDFNFLEDFL